MDLKRTGLYLFGLAILVMIFFLGGAQAGRAAQAQNLWIQANSTATVLLEVDAPPGANDDSYVENEDTLLAVAAPGVLANDNDPDGDALSAVLEVGPTHGSLNLNADGSFDYDPDPNYAGDDSFTYRSSDGRRTSPVAAVSITVNPVNDAPVSAPDAYAVNEDTALDIAAPGVLQNDGPDPDGPNALTAALVSNPASGTLTLNADGSFNYQPDPDYAGSDTFSYQASDGAGQSPVTQVSITVNPFNDAPAAVGDAYAVNEDTTLDIGAPGVLGNDSDPDGDSLTAVVASGPANGNLTLNSDGSFSYNPDPNFHGSDAFTYRAGDGAAQSPVVTVSITVNSVNDRPLAAANAYQTNEDVQLSVPAPGVLAGDSDVDGDALSAVVSSGPANGDLTLNSDGSFSYDPDPNFNGSDSFTYRASDGTLQSTPATVTITVSAVNDAPTTAADAYTVDEDGTLVIGAPGVLGGDSDVDGDSLTAIVETDSANGMLVLNANGSFTYTPNPNFDDIDSFTYRADDGTVLSSPTTVTITVTPINDQPLANGDSYQVNHPTVLSVPVGEGVLANDEDLEGQALQAVLVTQPTFGTLVFNPDGSFTYTPGAAFNGQDHFTYKASDGAATSNDVTVNLNVEDVIAPVVQWISPISPNSPDYPAYYMSFTETQLVLQLQVTDLNPIKHVEYYRYVAGAPVGQEYPLIAVVTSAPYLFILDTSVLRTGWNQIYGFAVDQFGNESVTEFFYIYNPTVKTYLPVVTR